MLLGYRKSVLKMRDSKLGINSCFWKNRGNKCHIVQGAHSYAWLEGSLEFKWLIHIPYLSCFSLTWLRREGLENLFPSHWKENLNPLLFKITPRWWLGFVCWEAHSTNTESNMLRQLMNERKLPLEELKLPCQNVSGFKKIFLVCFEVLSVTPYLINVQSKGWPGLSLTFSSGIINHSCFFCSCFYTQMVAERQNIEWQMRMCVFKGEW